MDLLKRLRETFSYAALDFYFGPEDPDFCILQHFHDEQMDLLHEMPSLHGRPIGSPSETYSHSMRVAEDAFTFALYIGLPMQIAKNIRWAVRLHDIGKLDIPIEILDKRGRLTDAEFEEMKKHTRYGAERIKSLRLDHKMVSLAHDIALYHHERHDGMGYYGLKGNEIPSRVRLLQLCDIYDAVSAPRPYRTEKEQLTPYETMKNLLDRNGFLHDLRTEAHQRQRILESQHASGHQGRVLTQRMSRHGNGAQAGLSHPGAPARHTCRQHHGLRVGGQVQ